MKPEDFYGPIEVHIGRVRIYGSENPRDSRAMTESELVARTQFFRLFGNLSPDEDNFDALFRFVMKNIQHIDQLKPIY